MNTQACEAEATRAEQAFGGRVRAWSTPSSRIRTQLKIPRNAKPWTGKVDSGEIQLRGLPDLPRVDMHKQPHSAYSHIIMGRHVHVEDGWMHGRVGCACRIGCTCQRVDF